MDALNDPNDPAGDLRAARLKKIVRWKLATFVVLTVGLAVPYFYLGPFPRATDTLLLVALGYAILMTTDAVCEWFDRRPPDWSNSISGFLLPVEPRGAAQVVAMIALVAGMLALLELRSCRDEGQRATTPLAEPQAE